MQPNAQKWRDHFAQCEAEQLARFPLQNIGSPLERAQFDIAHNYLRTQWNRFANHERVVALRADEPTRHAFFNFFESKQHNWFCFKREEWPSVFAGRRKGSGVWPFQTQRHEFRDCRLMETHELHQKLGEHFERLHNEPLFLRSYGFRDASRAGMGASDLWQWNGKTLVCLPEFESMWVS